MYCIYKADSNFVNQLWQVLRTAQEIKDWLFQESFCLVVFDIYNCITDIWAPSLCSALNHWWTHSSCYPVCEKPRKATFVVAPIPRDNRSKVTEGRCSTSYKILVQRLPRKECLWCLKVPGCT